MALGVILLLGAADVLDSGRLLDDWWPLVVVVTVFGGVEIKHEK